MCIKMFLFLSLKSDDSSGRWQSVEVPEGAELVRGSPQPVSAGHAHHAGPVV